MTTPTAVASVAPPHRTPTTGQGQSLPVPALDWANGQYVAVGSSSAQSAVFDANSDCVVEMCCDTDTVYAVGSNPTAATATAGNQFVPSGAVRYVYVPAGDKIAVIQNSASGHAYMIAALRQA